MMAAGISSTFSIDHDSLNIAASALAIQRGCRRVSVGQSLDIPRAVTWNRSSFEKALRGSAFLIVVLLTSIGVDSMASIL